MPYKTFRTLLALVCGLGAATALPGHAAGKIAFISTRDGNQEIYVMNSDGTGQTNITNTPGAGEFNPRWNSTGRRIAFIRGEDLWLANADGTGLVQMTTQGHQKGDPDWSFDDTKIVFSAFGGYDHDIFVIPVATPTDNYTRIINNPYGDYVPTCSPTADKIAFATFPTANPVPQIYLTNGDGSGQVQLTSNGHNQQPAWSPDGKKLAFESNRDNGLRLIYVMNADGSNQTRVSPLTTTYEDLEPEWSPDGTQIAFTSTREGSAKIFVMNADGTGATRLTNSAGTDSMATWVMPLPTGAPAISVGNITVNEGNSGTVNATFTLTLSAAFNQPVSVKYQTADGTATAPQDYVATGPGTVTFAAGQTSKTVTVPVVGDLISEPDESFSLQLSSPTNATLANSSGLCTITDSGDPNPTVSIAAASANEGNSGSSNLNFTLSLSSVSGFPVSVLAATSSGSGTGLATAGTDYTATSQTVTIPAGATTATFSVPIAGDTTIEPNETFTVSLSNPTNAGIGIISAQGTILNDDFPVLTIAGTSVPEGNTGSTTTQFTATLSTAYPQNVTFSYATADVTATAGKDYTAIAGNATIPAGQLSLTIPVTVLSDRLNEGDETFLLNVSNLANATLATANTGLIRFAGNGHCYQLNPNVQDWPGAEAAAESTSLLGVRGHLATITSAEEQAFITANFQYNIYIGGYQIPGSAEPAGGWTWVTGEPFTYTNWYPGEPNNGGGGESYLFITNSYTWNDYAIPYPSLMEYDVDPAVPVYNGQSIMTIVDDDPLPTLALSSTLVQEPASGNITAKITATLSAASGRNVTVNYYSVDGTAKGPADYFPLSGTLTFLPGETSKTINVTVVGDGVTEPQEAFSLQLSTPTNATIATGTGVVTIQDSAALVNISLTPATSYSANLTPLSLTTVYSDSNGATDISQASLLVNTTSSATNALYFTYLRAANKLYILDNSGHTILGGFAPGSANTIVGSQCALDCSNTIVTLSGSKLTIKWAVTPTVANPLAANVYLQVKDTAGYQTAWEQKGTWKIGNSLPANLSLTPATSASNNGVQHFLTTFHSDPDGAMDLANVQLLVNTSTSTTTNSIHAIYIRATNLLYLANGNAAIGGFAPGSLSTIVSSQATLDCSTTTVLVSGKNITVKWSLTPTVTTFGPRNVYLYSKDIQGAVTGFEQKGTWTIQSPSAPGAPEGSSVQQSTDSLKPSGNVN